MAGWFLDIRRPDGSRHRVPLRASPVEIGRDAGAAIRLDNPAVSRSHARLTQGDDGAWRIEDLKSRNGTTVKGELVAERALTPGDRIGIGGFQLVFVASAVAPRLESERGGTSILLSDAQARLDTLGELGIPRLSAEHLTGLNRLTRTLLGTAGTADRLAAMCAMWVSGQFRAGSALVLRVRRGGDDAPVTLHAARSETQGDGAGTEYVSGSLLRAVVERGEAVLASNVETPARAVYDVELSIAPMIATVAAAACPLRTVGDEVDVLYVSLPPMCATAEWLALISLASEQFQGAEEAWAARAAAGDRAAMERDLGRAVQIQRRLIPDERALERCRAAGVCAAVAYQPCQEVGGDYVDVMPTVDGRTLVLVADVSGHGLGAALVSSTVHAVVHAWAREGADVADLANALNRHLRETLPGDTFVTFMAALIDAREGGMRFVNAGHPPALVAGAQGVRRVDFGQNLPLGLDDAPLEAGEERLEEGVCLFL
jgi:hypothetical protein